MSTWLELLGMGAVALTMIYWSDLTAWWHVRQIEARVRETSTWRLLWRDVFAKDWL